MAHNGSPNNSLDSINRCWRPAQCEWLFVEQCATGQTQLSPMTSEQSFRFAEVCPGASAGRSGQSAWVLSFHSACYLISPGHA